MFAFLASSSSHTGPLPPVLGGMGVCGGVMNAACCVGACEWVGAVGVMNAAPTGVCGVARIGDGGRMGKEISRRSSVVRTLLFGTVGRASVGWFVICASSQTERSLVTRDVCVSSTGRVGRSQMSSSTHSMAPIEYVLRLL